MEAQARSEHGEADHAHADAQHDDLAPVRLEALERTLEPQRLLRQREPARLRAQVGGDGGERGIERHGARGGTAIAAVEVGQVADLVVGDAGEPGHQRAPIVLAERIEACEGAQQGGVQYVARPTRARRPRPRRSRIQARSFAP